jgi:FKBP-type peptidyl-prolyl cis-trans isomerase (trigger factor)
LPDSLLQAEIRRLNNDIQTKADQAKMSIKDYIDKQLGYKNQKDFDKVLNESSQKNLHLVIGIEKIIEELKIDITDKELDEHFTKMAKLYGTNVNDIKQRLQNNFEGVKTFLLQEKTFDKLIELNRNNK